MSNGVTVYPYAIIDDIVARLGAMLPGERRQVATKLAAFAPEVATALADALLLAIAVEAAEKKPVE